MCGINGLYYFDPFRPVEESLLSRMRQIASHRGPDDNGVYRSRNVGFSFSRLSIIDAAGGHQPMSNDDGSVWVVFNGEIYNFPELRSSLIQSGHSFKTRSDTETLLKAWEEYGEDCVHHLRGMFAFAVWDSRRRLLFAARDRLGIKPFYYHLDHEQFAFASEIKSLLEIPAVPAEVDTAALADYLRHGYVLTPHTLFRDIRKLPPGHSITVQRKGITIQRYWEAPLEEPCKINEAEAIEEFGSMLTQTIRMHLLSDVPVGVFLSGGLDSSSVVAVMARLGMNRIKTFSIGYDAPESELTYARMVAAQYKTEHHEMHLTHTAFRESLPNVVWHMDEPVADAPSVPFYFVSRFARSEVTVALSGEGADEILAGYPMYNRMLQIDRLNQLPGSHLVGRLLERWTPDGKFRKHVSMLGRPLESRYRAGVIFSLEAVARLLPDRDSVDDPYGSRAETYRRCEQLPSLARMSYVDLNTWLPNDLLLKADRMSMAHSLELRVPFLDHRLVEFCARLPQDLKIRDGVTKYVLRRLMQETLPAGILNRPKQGFSIPTKRWFRRELASFVSERLLDSAGACASFFPRNEIARLIAAHRYRDCADQLYGLLVFDAWYRAFVQSRAEIRRATAVSEI